MKRKEVRLKEELGRIFYAIIKLYPTFPDFGRYRIIIEPTFSPDTLLPTYVVGVVKDKEYLIIKTTILIKFSSSYDIKEFKVTGGLMTLRDVLGEIKKNTA